MLGIEFWAEGTLNEETKLETKLEMDNGAPGSGGLRALHDATTARGNGGKDEKGGIHHGPIQGSPSEWLRSCEGVPGHSGLGGGPQTMNTVDSVLSRNLRTEAEKRGYIVIAPAAPDDQLFFEDGARHLSGFSEDDPGGLQNRGKQVSHCRAVKRWDCARFMLRQRIHSSSLSVTAFPGYMWEPTNAKLQAISKMCVFMYVGELDEYMWHPEMQKEAEFLRAKGTSRITP